MSWQEPPIFLWVPFSQNVRERLSRYFFSAIVCRNTCIIVLYELLSQTVHNCFLYGVYYLFAQPYNFCVYIYFKERNRFTIIFHCFKPTFTLRANYKPTKCKFWWNAGMQCTTTLLLRPKESRCIFSGNGTHIFFRNK